MTSVDTCAEGHNYEACPIGMIGMRFRFIISVSGKVGMTLAGVFASRAPRRLILKGLVRLVFSLVRCLVMQM